MSAPTVSAMPWSLRLQAGSTLRTSTEWRMQLPPNDEAPPG
jgi:hypothetical protein